MAINKVKFGNQTLIDLTDTTATADKILTGFGAYGKDGVWMDGSLVPGADDGYVYQDENNYVVLDDDEGVGVGVTPLTVTENGTYNAGTRRAYNPVTVNVPERAPKFTAIWYNDYSGVKEVVCNKTYQEVFDYVLTDGEQLGVFVEDNESRTDPTPETPVYLYEVAVPQSDSVMKGIASIHIPYAQIAYYRNGEITVSYDEIDSLQTLNVTRNGTYTPGQDRVISEVTVNVQPSLITKTVTPQRTTQIVTPDVVDETTIISQALSSYGGHRVTSGSSWYKDVTLASGQESRFTSFPMSIHLYISFRSEAIISGGNTHMRGADTKIDRTVTLPSENYSVEIPVSSTYIKKVVLEPYASNNRKPRIRIYDPDTFSTSNFYVYIRNADVSFPQYGWSSAPYDNAFRIYPAEQYDGLSQVTVNGDADLVASNIKKDVEIFGVTGTYEGSSGGGVVEEKDVNFYDYDGTLLYSYTAQEFAQLSALPPNPSHEGLVAQGWNWTKTYIDNQLTGAPGGIVKVGQLYITESGNTEIDIDLTDSPRLSPTLCFCVDGTATVDWGDNTTPDTVTGSSASTTLTVAHTYRASGNYTISIHAVSGTYRFNRSSPGDTLFTWTTNNTGINTKSVYLNRVKRIRFGNGISTSGIGNYAFQYCRGLESVTIPTTFSSSSYTFQYCGSLKCVVLPTSKNINTYFIYKSGVEHVIPGQQCSSISSYAFSDCLNLASITIPYYVSSFGTQVFSGCDILQTAIIPSNTRATTLGQGMFYSCDRLTTVIIPEKITTIPGTWVYGCHSLSTLTLPSTITTVTSSAFSFNYGMKEYHFLSTTPPSLSSDSFDSIPDDCVIYVPSASLSDYQTATNWSTYASRMVGE